MHRRWLLGLSRNSWSTTPADSALSLSTWSVVTRYYPVPSRGLFLTGGLGLTLYEFQVVGPGPRDGFTSSGGAQLMGVGYDLRLRRGWYATPFVHAIAGSIDRGDGRRGRTGIAQLGLGLSRY